MSSFVDRVGGAIRLRAATFEEVEHDTSATWQAAAVVAVAGIANIVASRQSVPTAMVSLVAQMLGWVIGSAMLLLVGTKLMPGKATEADLGQLLRTVGFAEAAGIFALAGIVPGLAAFVIPAVQIWILVAMVIAVRQALDYEDTLSAVLVCFVTWAVMFAIQMAGVLLGLGAAAAGGGAL